MRSSNCTRPRLLLTRSTARAVGTTNANLDLESAVALALAPNAACEPSAQPGECPSCRRYTLLNGIWSGERFCSYCALDLAGDQVVEALEAMRPYSDNDWSFATHCANGLLALLWGEVPGRDNVATPLPGDPNLVPDYVRSDLSNPQDESADRVGSHAYVMRQAWARIIGYCYLDGPQHLLDVITYLAESEDVLFARVALLLWPQMVAASGPNPYGLDRSGE